MKQLMRNVWRFVSDHPWVGSGLFAAAWSLLIVFCLCVWYRCGFCGEVPDDTILLLKKCFYVLFVLLVVAGGLAFVQFVVHWLLNQSKQMKVALWGVVILFAYVVMAVLFVGPFACFVYEKLNPAEYTHWTVQCSNIDDSIMDKYRYVVIECIPKGASELYVDFTPAGLLMSSRKFVRCRVAPEDLHAFIKEHQYNFRFDSTRENEDAGNPYARLGWPDIEGKSLSGSQYGSGFGDLDEYWSYNYINDKGNGCRMFYDVRRQLFYYDWSSN